MLVAEIPVTSSLRNKACMDQFFFEKDSPMLGRMSKDPDSALMLQYQQGDTKAFQDLYERHKGPVYRYFLRHGQDPRWAEELYQEVWMKIIRARNQYRPLAKFSTYLFQLAHNCLVDHIRRQTRRPQLVAGDEPQFEAVDNDHSLEHKVSTKQIRQLFARALQQLPVEQKEAFVLREETGLNLNEIAKITGVGRETVKSRLRYANKKLKELVAQAVGESYD